MIGMGAMKRTPLLFGACAMLVPLIANAWQFDTEADSMGRGTIKSAIAASTNDVNFRFPYSGEQRAMLQLRIHPQYGRDVILYFKKAHFNCSMIDGCAVLVRFDEGKPQRYSAMGPSDHSNNTLFIHNFDRFVQQARKAKTVKIEAEFYQDGTRVLEFDVANLGEWPNGTITPATPGAAAQQKPK